MSVIIDQGKSLLIKCLGTTPVNAVTGMREVLFELNGEARLIQIEDKNAATEVVRRERSIPNEPGSVGCTLLPLLTSIRVAELMLPWFLRSSYGRCCCRSPSSRGSRSQGWRSSPSSQCHEDGIQRLGTSIWKGQASLRRSRRQVRCSTLIISLTNPENSLSCFGYFTTVSDKVISLLKSLTPKLIN